MGGRRARIQVKPNVKAKATPIVPPRPAEVAEEAAPSVIAALLQSPPKPMRPPPQPIMPPPRIPNNENKEWVSAQKEAEKQAPATAQATGGGGVTRRFACTAELDRSKFTMADLTYWNPKKGHRLGPEPTEDDDDFHPDGRKKRRRLSTMDSDNPLKREIKKRDDGVKVGVSMAPMAGPRVVVGLDGQLVVDEESLVIEQGDGSGAGEEREILDEGSGIGQIGRRVTNFSFRRRPPSRHRHWTKEETDAFFMCLSAAGTDFFLLKEFFPKRTVHDLKRKYRIEHKNNPARIDRAFTGMNRLALDPALYEVVSTKRNKHQRKKQRLTNHIQNGLIDPRNPTECEAESALEKEYEQFSSDGTDSEAEAEATGATPAASSSSIIPSNFDIPLSRRPAATTTAKGDSPAKTFTATKIRKDLLESLMDSVVRDGGSAGTSGVAGVAATGKKAASLSQTEIAALMRSIKAAQAGEKTTMGTSVVPEGASVDLAELCKDGGSGGGNLLLVHEKSSDPTTSDVIHIYLLQDRPPGASASNDDVPSTSAKYVDLTPTDQDDASGGSVVASSVEASEASPTKTPKYVGGGASGGEGLGEVVEFVDVDTVEPEPLRLLLHHPADSASNVQYYTTQQLQYYGEEEDEGGYEKTISDVIETVCHAGEGGSGQMLIRVEDAPAPPQIRLVKKCRVRSNMAEVPSVSAIVDYVAAGGGSYEDLFPAEVAEMEYHDRKVSFS